MNNKKFMLGANYWGSEWGTEMWLHYNGKKIREDLKQLAEYGVQNLRVFPNWRDFQPVDRAYACRGMHGEYINARTGAPVYDDGVDPEMIDHMKDFCKAAEENGIELVVSIVTGWMSGRLFCPPVLNGKNLITDPEALMWMRRFIKRLVRELKSEKSIVMWGLGNECNCLGDAGTRYYAYQWTATVVDAIRSEDKSRPISSDMHGLCSGPEKGFWFLEDQGELTDMVCTHPYPSPSVGGDIEPYTRLRTSCIPTAQTLYYQGVSQKPAYIQESGTFSQTIGSNRMAADFMRIQILSSIAHNFTGYQWWCAWEQSHLAFPPYTWAMIERELGLFDKNKKPKPVAFVMKNMSELVNKLPYPFPKRKTDAVCVLPREGSKLNMAIASVLFGKQAGVELEVAYSEVGNLPESKLYYMPCIGGWQVIYKKTWDTLLKKVENGATLCISFNGGQITDFPDIVGAESMGFMDNVSHTVEMDGEKIPYTCKEILLKPITAKILYANEEDNPVMLKNKYGKGTVYFINLPVEKLAIEKTDGFNLHPYYKFYKEAAMDVIVDKEVIVEDKNIGVTINAIDDHESFVTLLNYSDKAIKPEIKINDHWSVEEVVYGDMNSIPACDGVFLKIKMKK